ncbi:MAG: transporter [Bacteroidetes bacterium RIFOXYA12_FULL_35_11]|nr:MAG: transporter [Bacteroidetes bacterium GWF2_35_48]OFY77166.1 MAG: transporter [Bacteroidetes bacterium RIFOXYA12_FULL_35_11]OFY93260.1 MAG: transporter [Bacteroidetes bacterium RIFOXYC12_FULL_35_7]OFY97816.1 MAG: transporter [Bacteroidetes bacterium RIFOXYB2_FULL_35_7]HBX50110.1 MFS transporter [Bacteroidales bacterium]
MTEKVQRLLRDSKTARWFALGLISLTMFFAYFFVDVASPIKNQFEINYHWSSEVFGLYGGMEFFFNVFFAFLILSGIILDKMGIRFTLLTAGLTMVGGAFLKFYALKFIDTATMTSVFGYTLPMTALIASVGFAVFGIGVEMAGITVSKTIVKWFRGKELALAMGLEMAIARLGVFAVMWLSPFFANNGSSNPAEWTTANAFLWGAIFLTIGFLTFFIYTFMDRKLDKEMGITKQGGSGEEEFKIKDIGKIFANPGFLAIAGLCVLFYSAIFPFQRFATEMLSSKLAIDPKEAARYVSMFPIGAMILTPFIGFFLDRKGLGATLMLYGAILLTISHLIFALVPAESFSQPVAIGTIVILGIAFSLVPASMWPSLPKIVEDRYLGSAYGAIFWIQNMGLLGVPILIGYALSASNPEVVQFLQENAEAIKAGTIQAPVYNYTVPELIFAGFGVLAVVLSLILKYVDKKHGYGLDIPNIKK